MCLQELPKAYMGYLTTEFLEIHEALSTSPMQEKHRQALRNASSEEIRAAQRLVWDFQLTPAAEHAAEKRKIWEKELVP